MHKILDEHYKKKSGRSIQFADLGHSTSNFNFFVTRSISESITLSSGSGANASFGLMNKLISLSSEGKFSIVDSVIEKVEKGTLGKKSNDTKSVEIISEESKTFQVFSSLNENTSKFEVIKEAEEEEDAQEKEILEEIKAQERAANPGAEDVDMVDVEEADKYAVVLQKKPLDTKMTKWATYNSTCHTWFIVKDKGVAINWKKPLLQKSQITSKIRIAPAPFAEGAMRYAFQMQDCDLSEKYVVKVPKNLNPKSYNLEEMKSDIEAMFVCSHVVNEFNEKLIATIDSRYLVEFVHSFIYEILDEGVPFKYYYGENFIQGKYEKFNNNAGYVNNTGQDANQSLIAQTLSHFSWQLTQGYLMIVDI